MRIRYDFSAKKTGKTRKPATTNKHKVAFPKQVREMIRTSDIILEVLDARFIDKTRNRELEREVLDQEKKLIYVLNKVDLVEVSELKKNVSLEELEPYVLFSCKNRVGRARLRERIKIEVKKLKLGDKKARVGIIGYPNTGKSSLINILAGRKGVGTSAQAGFTKATHKIRFTKDILILDTPGVIPDEEFAERTLREKKKHVQISTTTFDKVRDPEMIIAEFMKQNPGVLEEFYEIEAEGDSEVLLDELGSRRKFMKKGGLIDTERTARLIIKDMQKGKIRFSP
jgi:ribosome biogenesis GTPase A